MSIPVLGIVNSGGGRWEVEQEPNGGGSFCCAGGFQEVVPEEPLEE